MHGIRAKFDGKRIEAPAELRGAAPGDLVIDYYPENLLGESASNAKSIWDVFGKAAHQRTAEDINAEVRADREDWDRE